MKLSKSTQYILKDSYWLSRILFTKSLAFVQIVAFSVALLQNVYLIGTHGLTPADKTIQLRKDHHLERGTFYDPNLNPPTLFWLIEPNDLNLSLVAFSGLILANIVFFHGQSNVIINFIIWILYLSLVNVGNIWYSFGWESQLLETTFLSLFIVPLFSLNRFSSWTQPSFIGIWGNKWLLFRIMIGAGLIKIRRDKCWLDLTCMNYHYLTQPVPNPFSSLFHATPDSFHQFETAFNHVIELVFPWLLLLPYRPLRHFGALTQLLFQCILISTGNLAFINWLTMVPAFLAIDDSFYAYFDIFDENDVEMAYQTEKKYRLMTESSGIVTVIDNELSQPLHEIRELLTEASTDDLLYELYHRNVTVSIRNTAITVTNNTHPSSIQPQLSGGYTAIETKHSVAPSRTGIHPPIVDLTTEDPDSPDSAEEGVHTRSRLRNVVTSVEEAKGEDSYRSEANKKANQPHISWAKISINLRRIVSVLMTIVIVWRSIPVVKNLLSQDQIMNANFDPFRITNAYGLFGTITKERNEIIIQGTLDSDPMSPTAEWFDYEFTCKPGNINRRPCLITPYHLRMDWLMWFAAFQDYTQCPWVIHLIYKLLQGDSAGRALLAAEPFGDPFLAMEKYAHKLYFQKLSEKTKVICTPKNTTERSIENITKTKRTLIHIVNNIDEFINIADISLSSLKKNADSSDTTTCSTIDGYEVCEVKLEEGEESYDDLLHALIHPDTFDSIDVDENEEVDNMNDIESNEERNRENKADFNDILNIPYQVYFTELFHELTTIQSYTDFEIWCRLFLDKAKLIGNVVGDVGYNYYQMISKLVSRYIRVKGRIAWQRLKPIRKVVNTYLHTVHKLVNKYWKELQVKLNKIMIIIYRHTNTYTTQWRIHYRRLLYHIIVTVNRQYDYYYSWFQLVTNNGDETCTIVTSDIQEKPMEIQRILPTFIRAQLYKYEYIDNLSLQSYINAWIKSIFFDYADSTISPQTSHLHMITTGTTTTTTTTSTTSSTTTSDKDSQHHPVDPDGWEHGLWWKRKYIRSYIPPIELNNPTLKQFLESHQMI